MYVDIFQSKNKAHLGLEEVDSPVKIMPMLTMLGKQKTLKPHHVNKLMKQDDTSS